MKHVLFLAVFLGGCGSDEVSDSAEGAPADAFKGAPLAELSSGDCPKLANPGERTFTSDGQDRTVTFHFPRNPQPGLPVIFFWHGIGDSAPNFSRALGLEEFAEANNAVVVVPHSLDPMLLTWNIFDGGADAVLYDDVRTCLANELDVDLARFSTTGFSYGGLMATWLAVNRGDTLASVVAMSGGTSDALGFGYAKPASNLPALVMWGGEDDVFDAGILSVDFRECAVDFADHLEADGHLVARCNHGLGHALPTDYADAMTPWLLEHTYGEPSPFASELAGFPEYCSL